MASLLFDVYYRYYDNFMRTFKLDDDRAIVGRIEALAGKRQLSICDIGGGTGLLAHRLIGLGHQVTIIDPAPKMTEIALQRNPKVIIINETIEKTRPDRTYDVIILKDCLHHLQAQAEGLGQISRLLKNDGLLIIQEFYPGSIQAKFLFLLERCCWEKVRPLHPDGLTKMMSAAGFLPAIERLNGRDYLATGVKGKNREGQI